MPQRQIRGFHHVVVGAVVLGLGLVVASPAWAQDHRSRVPGTALTIEAAGNGLYVRDATRRAPFVPDPWSHADLIVHVDASAKGDAVEIVVEYNCGGGRTFKTTTQVLRARLENAAALALHGKQQWDAAAAGFARALALDPSFELAALNLASAQARGGHGTDAVATLVALAQRNPPLVVWRLFADSDLASVASAPELVALATPTGQGKAATHTDRVAYAASRHLIAWLRTGGDPSGASYDEVRIVDAVTGKTLVGMARSRRTEPSIDRTLAALDFVPVTAQGLETTFSDDPSTKAKLVFPGTKLGVVVRAGEATIVTGDHVLGEGSINWARHYDVALLPDVVLFVSSVVVGEGCGGDTYDVADVIALRAPAAPPAPAHRR